MPNVTRKQVIADAKRLAIDYNPKQLSWLVQDLNVDHPETLCAILAEADRIRRMRNEYRSDAIRLGNPVKHSDIPWNTIPEFKEDTFDA